MESELNLEFCSVCAKIGSNDDKFTNFNFTQSEEISFCAKLQFCFPDIDLEINTCSQICKECSIDLETSYAFKSRCLETASKLKEFRNAQNERCDIENETVNQELTESKSKEQISENNNNLREEIIHPVQDMIIDLDMLINQSTVEGFVDTTNENNASNNNIKCLNNRTVYQSNNILVCDDLNFPTLSKKHNADGSLQMEVVKGSHGNLLSQCLTDIPNSDVFNSKRNTDESIISMQKNQTARIKKSIESNNLGYLFTSSSTVDVQESTNKNKINCINSKRLVSGGRYKSLLVNKHKKKSLSKKRIIEYSCKRIPELNNCSPKSLQCKVVLERLALPIKSEEVKLSKTLRHNPGFRCIICKTNIYRKHRFNSHFLRHINVKPYECDKCSVKYYSRDQLIKHHRIRHNIQDNLRNDSNIRNMSQTADKLVEAFLIKKGLSFQKIEIKSNVKNNQLKLPTKNLKKLKILKDNKKLIIKKKFKTANERGLNYNVYFCDLCDYHSYYKQKYETHMRRHDGIKPFECSECFERFYEKWHLNRHKRNKHCKKVNKIPTQVEMHKFTCEICQQKYVNEAEYLKHKRDHTIIQQSNCIQPNSSINLNNIRKRKKYYCEICNLEFSHRDHKYVHTGEKPYKCETCLKCFAARTTLRKHKLTHLKNKNRTNIKKKIIKVKVTLKKILCKTCKKLFSKKEDLHSHQCCNKY